MTTEEKKKIFRLGQKIINFLNAIYARIMAALKTAGNFISNLIGAIILLVLLVLLIDYWLGSPLDLYDNAPFGVKLIVKGFASIVKGIATIALGIISWLATTIWDLILNLFSEGNQVAT